MKMTPDHRSHTQATPRWLTWGALLATSGLSLDAAIVQRWSFNTPTGDAVTGTPVANEVAGGEPAVIRGAGAQFTRTAVKIPGGNSDTAAYVDLPNGIVSGLTECTLEGWVSVDAGGWNWGRIFDFGDSLGGELTDVGGGGEGRDYLALTASRGTDYNVQRLEWRNETPGGPGPGGATTLDSGLPTTFGRTFHYAVTVKPDGAGGSLISYWRDGVLLNTDAATAFSLADINDVNNWLGRSNWTGDQNAAASFDEFRVYDTALDDTAIQASRTAGPNAGLPDGDGDGIPNFWELYYPSILNPATPGDAALDGDSDGLSNLGEFQRGTDPLVTDSDGDGLGDGAEVNTHLTNPADTDTDDDGLTDGAEVLVHLTNPTNPDTDGDSFTDGSEVTQGTDPRNPSSVPLLLLVNRYDFNQTAGSTDRVVRDATGGLNGAILGDGFSWSGTGLALDGGSGETAAYVDLPNYFLSRHARANGGSGTLTLEGWVTVTSSAPVWARIFDFGSSLPSSLEITGPGNANGGGTEGRDYLMLSAYNGNDTNFRRLEWRNFDPQRNNGVLTADHPTATFNSEFHFVVTVDEITKKARVYENGARVSESNLTWGLDKLNDNNCWLGRSNWTDDGNMAGTFNEFRVYSGIMTEAQAAASATAGPGTVPVFDTDSDGIPDWYELRYGMNRNNAADAASDADGDSLTALQEYQRGSRPNAADSDGDGLSDVAETNTGTFVSAANTGTHPGVADTDGDGAADGAEVAAGANPFVYDTDGDGVSDGVEIRQGTSPSTPGAVFPPLAHRWSFDDPAGEAADGAPTADSIGSQPAFIRGSGAQFTGTAVELPGGASNIAPYIDLPNGILSSRRIVAFEGWYSVSNTANAWGRVFDFGDSLGEELLGPGGGGEGKDYLALTASRGNNYDQQRIEWRDETPAGGGAFTFDSDVPTSIGDGSLVHIVVTVDNSLPDTTILNYWRDGEIRTAFAVASVNTSDVNDVNNWLGRSNWVGDANLAGTFEEFRVYNGVLNEAAVQANFAAGPNVVPGGPAPSPLAVLSVSRDAATGAVTIVWASAPGKSYAVSQSDTMATGSWADVPGTIASGGATTSVTITPPAAQTVRFYRIKQL